MNDDVALVDQIAKLSIHRPEQSDNLAREIRALEWALNGRSEHNGQPMPQFASGGDDAGNREYLQESLTRTRRLHDAHAAEGWSQRFNGYEKNLIYRESKRVEKEIVDGMPTHEMMQEPSSTNVDWWMAWHRSIKKRVLFWRNARRILDPRNDNHNFGNVDILRKHELTGSDPRKYWTGYEQIAFSERVEEAIDQITDAQYHVFLTLKAQDWAPMNIMRKLGWTKPTYEAAMARLRLSAGSPEAYDEPSVVGTDTEAAEAAVPDAPAVPVELAPPGDDDPALMTSREWRALLAERGITQKTAARAIHMNFSTFKARLEGRGRFTEAQRTKLWDLAHSKAPVASVA